MSNKHCKVVIFDMDETLGYFTQLDIFINSLKSYYKKNIEDKHFFEIIDLFDNYLRPNILYILKYLKNKKDNNYCSKIMLYTNNNSGKKWPNKIVNYFNNKLNCKLFDNVICSFKIKDKIIEPNRTSNNKSYDDIIKCSKIPFNTHMFFLDDKHHKQMVHNNVYYINIKQYIYNYTNDDLINIYKEKYNIKDDNFYNIINNYLIRSKYKPKFTSNIEIELDKTLSKKIMNELNYFFNKFKKTLKTDVKYKNNKTFKKKKI
tara:strand:- start:691 stop:1470 length:780 start_codon:yes stop_codon:yes gene_type:complete